MIAGTSRRSEPKQVMFSDGIRPGGDLTELDGHEAQRGSTTRRNRPPKRSAAQGGFQHSLTQLLFKYIVYYEVLEFMF